MLGPRNAIRNDSAICRNKLTPLLFRVLVRLVHVVSLHKVDENRVLETHRRDDAKAAHHVRAVSKQLEALAGRQDSACVDLERKLQRRIQVMIRTESVMPVNVG